MHPSRLLICALSAGGLCGLPIFWGMNVVTASMNGVFLIVPCLSLSPFAIMSSMFLASSSLVIRVWSEVMKSSSSFRSVISLWSMSSAILLFLLLLQILFAKISYSVFSSGLVFARF